MLRKFLLALLLFLLFFPLTVGAADPVGAYLGVAGGIGKPESMTVQFGNEIGFERGAAFSLFGGYDFGFWRLELEGNWRRNDIDSLDTFGTRSESDGTVTATSLLLNGYLDYENSTLFTPWLGVGAGLADLSFTDLDESAGNLTEEGDLYLALQLLLGVSVDFRERFSAQIGYRLLWIPEVEFEEETFDSTSSENYLNHAVMVGLGYYF